jgi:hypothetical protein
VGLGGGLRNDRVGVEAEDVFHLVAIVFIFPDYWLHLVIGN